MLGEEGDPSGADGEGYVFGEAEDAGFEDIDGLARVCGFEGGVCGLRVIRGDVSSLRVAGDEGDPGFVCCGEFFQGGEGGCLDAEGFRDGRAVVAGDGVEGECGLCVFGVGGEVAGGGEGGGGEGSVAEGAEGFRCEQEGGEAVDLVLVRVFRQGEVGADGGLFFADGLDCGGEIRSFVADPVAGFAEVLEVWEGGGGFVEVREGRGEIAGFCEDGVNVCGVFALEGEEECGGGGGAGRGEGGDGAENGFRVLACEGGADGSRAGEGGGGDFREGAGEGGGEALLKGFFGGVGLEGCGDLRGDGGEGFEAAGGGDFFQGLCGGIHGEAGEDVEGGGEICCKGPMAGEGGGVFRVPEGEGAGRVR